MGVELRTIGTVVKRANHYAISALFHSQIDLLTSLHPRATPKKMTQLPGIWHKLFPLPPGIWHKIFPLLPGIFKSLLAFVT